MLLPTLYSSFESTSCPTRIVWMSSVLYYITPSSTKFASVEELNRDLGGNRLYGRSKLANILGAQEMARRMDSGELGPKASSDQRAVYVNVVHPGGAKTASQAQAVDTYGWAGWVLMAIVRPFFSDPVTTGCRSALFAATSPEIEEKSIHGAYVAPDKHVVKPMLGKDEEMGKRLWNLSLAILKDKISP